MRYLLVIGFACDVYQREPLARIFVGNKLIDEFCVSQHADTLLEKNKELKKQEIVQPNFHPATLEIKFLPTLKFYEIDIDPGINKLDLRIEIKNQDNNYNNGFMNRGTLIQLRVCYFFPLDKKLLLRLKSISDKNKFRQNYAWFRRNNNSFFNLSENAMTWYGSNLQIVESKKFNMFFTRKFGGDGVFAAELIKKYKIFIAHISHPFRFRLQLNYLNYFLYKYQQHANLRNNN